MSDEASPDDSSTPQDVLDREFLLATMVARIVNACRRLNGMGAETVEDQDVVERLRKADETLVATVERAVDQHVAECLDLSKEWAALGARGKVVGIVEAVGQLWEWLVAHVPHASIAGGFSEREADLAAWITDDQDGTKLGELWPGTAVPKHERLTLERQQEARKRVIPLAARLIVDAVAFEALRSPSQEEIAASLSAQRVEREFEKLWHERDPFPGSPATLANGLIGPFLPSGRAWRTVATRLSRHAKIVRDPNRPAADENVPSIEDEGQPHQAFDYLNEIVARLIEWEVPGF